MQHPGISLSDFLASDFETMFEVLSAKSERSDSEEVMSMEDFMRANPHI